MAEQMRPASPHQAPDPATTYERAKPEREAGMGRMENDPATPQETADQSQDAVKHRQENRQLNASDAVNQRGGPTAESRNVAGQPDHSMKDEEPLDEPPPESRNPREQRHPRREGKGGVD